jgi:hypothetical protein
MQTLESSPDLDTLTVRVNKQLLFRFSVCGKWLRTEPVILTAEGVLLCRTEIAMQPSGHTHFLRARLYPALVQIRSWRLPKYSASPTSPRPLCHSGPENHQLWRTIDPVNLQ